MKYFIRLLSVSLVSAALVGCSFNGRIPSSRASYPDVEAGGYTALELLDMQNKSEALVYRLQTGRPDDPAYAEMRRRMFEDDNVITVQVMGGHLLSTSTCTAFRIGADLITSPERSVVPREVLRKSGYAILNDSMIMRMPTTPPPGYAFVIDQHCLAEARSRVPPPPGGWVKLRP